VLKDITNAPIAGGKTKPRPDRIPAAKGMV